MAAALEPIRAYPPPGRCDRDLETSSAISLHCKACGLLIGPAMGGVFLGSERSARGRPPLRVSSECASTLKHPPNARVHLFLVDQLPACDLIKPRLHLLF